MLAGLISLIVLRIILYYHSYDCYYSYYDDYVHLYCVLFALLLHKWIFNIAQMIITLNDAYGGCA